MRIILNLKQETMLRLCSKIAAAAIATLIALPALAAVTPQPVDLTCDGGHFQPAALEVAANQSVRIKVTNSGTSPIEFESFELNRERVIPPGHTITVILPRLDPGQYHFFDDFHHETGQGTITAR